MDEERTVDRPAVQQDTKASQVSCKLNAGLVSLSLMFNCCPFSSVHFLSLGHKGMEMFNSFYPFRFLSRQVLRLIQLIH